MHPARDPKRGAEKEACGREGELHGKRGPTDVDPDPWDPSVAEFRPGSGSGSFVSSKGESGQPVQPFNLEKRS